MREKWKHEPDLDPAQPLAAAQQRKYNAAQRQVHAALNGGRKAEAQARREAKAAENAALKAVAEAVPPQFRPPPPGRRAHPDLIVGLAAAGVAQTRIAQALHVHPQQIGRALDAVPGSRERIAALREELKGIKLTRAHAVETKLWDRLEHEVGEKGEDGTWVGGGAAKDVDAVTRALLASEKIQAAAAGEAHASGAGPEPPSPGELTVLVQALLSAPSA